MFYRIKEKPWKKLDSSESCDNSELGPPGRMEITIEIFIKVLIVACERSGKFRELHLQSELPRLNISSIEHYLRRDHRARLHLKAQADRFKVGSITLQHRIQWLHKTSFIFECEISGILIMSSASNAQWIFFNSVGSKEYAHSV